MAKMYAAAHSMSLRHVFEAGLAALLDEDPTLRGFIAQIINEKDGPTDKET